MSDGINDGNPLGRPRTREELLVALEEAQRFGQHRTQEVVDLRAALAASESSREEAIRERDEARSISLQMAEVAARDFREQRDSALTALARATTDKGGNKAMSAREQAEKDIAECYDAKPGLSAGEWRAAWAALRRMHGDLIDKSEALCKERDEAGARTRALAGDVLAAEAQRDAECAARGRLVVFLKATEQELDSTRKAVAALKEMLEMWRKKRVTGRNGGYVRCANDVKSVLVRYGLT